MLTTDRVLDIFNKTGVLKQGHFLLTSGRHSDRYLQCAQVLQYPDYTEELCEGIADKFKHYDVELVVAPAVGGILLSYEVGRQLKVPAIFAEREGGTMTFRRGFHIPPGKRVLVVEDVVTTGGSVRDVVELVQQSGGEVVGVGLLVDRSGGTVDFGVPTEALMAMEVVSYAPEDCPLCKQGVEGPVKPGSRNI